MTLTKNRTWVVALVLGLSPAALSLTQCHPPPAPPTQATSNSAIEPGVSASGSAGAPAALSPAEIDRMVQALWARDGVQPTAKVDDARFLRRVSLDLRGVIPSPDEVEKFLADPAADKRARAIDRMLADPRYADHWTNYWDRTLMGREVKNALVDRGTFRAWVHQKIAADTPWDKLVYELVTATGQNRPEEGNTEKVNGAVNWLLKYRDAPADLTGATSRIFLGVQIQCAQCHDHKTEKWKTEDFQKLTACFIQTKGELIERDGRQRRIELTDTDKVPRGMKKKGMLAEYVNATPGALDGTDLSSSPNRRQALASWMVAPQNPWFARAIVNRMWGHFFGRGVVDPIDDFRDSNPPVAPELLSRLADDLVAQRYDLKGLMRRLVNTEAYQLAAGPRAADKPAQGRLWARYRMMPLGPDELLDSLVAATKIDALLARTNEDNLDKIRLQMRNQFNVLFDVDEEDSDDDFDGTIAQALMLLNGRLTNTGVTAVPGTALSEVLALPGGDDVKIRALYLRALSRLPSAEEVTRWQAFLAEPREAVHTAGPAPDQAPKGGKGGKKKGAVRDPLTMLDKGKGKGKAGGAEAQRQAYEDMFWALLNSSEFFFNH